MWPESHIHFQATIFSWDLYGTQSISVVFIVTLVSSLLLAMAMQKLFNRMIPSNPQTQSKTL